MAKFNLKAKKRSILIVAALLLIVIGYFVFDRYMPMRISGDPVVLPSDVLSSHEIAVVDDQLILVNTKGVLCYDEDGEYQWNCALKTAAPFLVTSGESVVVGDTENAEVDIIKDGRVSKTIAENEKISGIAVNENGRVAVVTTEPGYRSVVKVYNDYGKCVYEWYSGHIYVTAVALSQNDKYMAVAGLNPEAKDVECGLYFFDLSKEKPLGETVLSGAVAYKMVYDNKNVYVLSDKGIYNYTKNGKLSDSYDFMGRRLQAFSFENQEEMAIALSRSDATGSMLSGSEVVVFSEELEVECNVDTDFEITAMDISDGFVAAAGLRNVRIIRSNGDVRAKGELQSDCESIRLFSGGTRFATLSDSTVHIYELEYDF